MKRFVALIFATILSIIFWCSCSEKEQEIPVASVTLSQPAAEMIVGESITLKATISPSNATEQEIMWASSKQSVATVNQSGTVVAIAEGTSTITATAGGKMGSCVVTVSKGVVDVSSINLDKTSASLKVGETVTLTATVKPDDATDKTVTWSTSDASVATVSDGVVTAVKLGTATITAKAGDKEATCSVTVEATPVTSVTLDQTSASLKVGETVTLTATVKPDDATDKTVTWSTSDASVATVSDGVVTAIKLGSATIRAKAGDKEATCAITVEATPVTSVTLDQTSASLKVGETVTLTATVKPDDATDKTVTWSTSDASVATVSNGVVTAKKIGTATITAKAGDKEATCSIMVVATPVTSVTLDKTSASLKVGETVTLTATVKPDDATDKTVTWNTSDASVATVSNGVVTAKKIGTAAITVKAGDKEATCSVTVEATPVTSITLDKTSASLKVGETVTLTATVKPDDATDKTVTWSTSDASVATVSNGVVTAKKIGTATITAKAGDKEAICAILIEGTPITSISLDSSSLSLVVGDTFTLVATILPTNATDNTLTWTSSNELVATINNNGMVTALSKGKTTIKATANDGSNVSAYCGVIVSSPCPTGAVDMGLTTTEGYKLYWASCNVCETGFVNSPEKYGDYYAWGEVEPHYMSGYAQSSSPVWKTGMTGYSWETYKWSNGSSQTIIKYNCWDSYGVVDNKTVLEAEDDVACVKLGGNWRMPRDEEWTSLRTQCTWTWTTKNGIKGRLVTAKNGNSIFLPASPIRLDSSLFTPYQNECSYPSSSLCTVGMDVMWCVRFSSTNYERSSQSRAYGLTVRAVSE